MRSLLNALLVICLTGYGFGQATSASNEPCNQAAEYFNAKKYELAMAAYSSCIESNPDNAKTWYYMGNCAFNIKKYQEAIRAYDQAISLDSNYTNPRLHKGYTQLNLNQYASCIETLTELLEIDPSQVNAYKYRGAAYMKSDLYLEAIADFTTSIIQSEPLYSNFLNRGLCRVKMLDKIGALNDFRAASDLKPKEFTPIEERVKIYMELLMWPEAISDATLALSKNPTATELYFCRGYAKLMTDDILGADIDFNTCLQLDPNHIQALKNKSITSVSMKKYEEAVMDLTNLIKTDSKNADLYLQRGNCFLASNSYKKALADYNQAILIKSDFGEAYFNRANIYSNFQNSKQACKDIMSAVQTGYEPANAYVVFLCK